MIPDVTCLCLCLSTNLPDSIGAAFALKSRHDSFRSFIRCFELTLTKTTLSHRWLLLIAAILVFAFAVRVVGSGYPMWTDEGWSIWFTEPGGFSDVYSRLDRHPPLYFYTLLVWRDIAGDSHLALRMLSMFAGLMTVALSFRIASDVFNRRVGFYASLLVAALPMSAYYGQEVRHYGWLTLFALLTILLFLRFLREPTPRRGIPYGVCVALLMAVNYLGALVMAIQAAAGLFIWRGTLRQKAGLIAVWISAVVLYLPWLLTGFRTQLDFMSVGIGGLPGTFETTVPNLLDLLETMSGGQTALLAGLFAAAVLHMRPRFGDWFMLLSGFGLVVLIALLNLEYGLLSTRSLAVTLPPLLIVCAWGLAALPDRIGPILLLGSVIISLLYPVIVKSRISTEDVIAVLQSQANPGDLIVLETGVDDMAMAYEVEQALPELALIPTYFLGDGANVRTALADDLAASQRVWVIHWTHAPTIITDLRGNGTRGDEIFTEVQTHPVLNEQNPLDLPLDDFIDVALFVKLGQDPIIFGEQVRLDGAIIAASVKAGQTLFIDTVWSAVDSIEHDYSVAILLQDSTGTPQVQVDAPLPGPPSTSWNQEQQEIGRFALEIPSTLAPGEYEVAIIVYFFEAPDAPLTANGQSRVAIGTVQVD